MALERLREDKKKQLDENNYFNMDVIGLTKQFYKEDIYSLLKQKIRFNL